MNLKDGYIVRIYIKNNWSVCGECYKVNLKDNILEKVIGMSPLKTVSYESVSLNSDFEIIEIYNYETEETVYKNKELSDKQKKEQFDFLEEFGIDQGYY
jgi:hypothetical protein